MKTSTKKLSVIFAILLFFVVLFAGLPEILVGHASDAEVEKSDKGNAEVAFSLDGANYQYYAPKTASFDVEAVEGIAVLDNDEIYLAFNDTEVVIPCFDFYRLLDTQNEVMFYQADVAKDTIINETFAYVAVMPNRGNNYDLIVHYGEKEDWILYIIRASLTKEMFDFIDAKSNDLHIGDDEVSQRLKASSKAHMQGTHKKTEQNQIINANQIATAAINEHAYDSYTNSDELIFSYSKLTKLTRTFTADGYFTDDPIVRIIPKALWSIAGEHIYIGKEYGFFIKVVKEMALGVGYTADILVFDIFHEAPSFPQNPTGTCKIIPLFNWRYQSWEKSMIDWSDCDPSLSQIITPASDYDQAELFLDDIGIKISIENPDALNPDDVNYNPIEDDGAFIIQTRANANGVGLKKKKGSFLADTLLCAFGFVPYAGAALNIYSYMVNLYDGFGNGGYLYSRSTTLSDNEANIETYETNNTDQINQRGHLIKSKAVTIKSDSDSPRLINVGGYAEIKYVVARRSGSSYSKLRIITSVSANVLEDNTTNWWEFPWWDHGDIVNYGRAIGTYETTEYKRLENVTVNGGTQVSVPASKDYQMIKFVPKIGGEYRLETVSDIGDPIFSIRNATKKTNTVHATDDIDGENNRNARLIIDLIAGDTYYITADSFNSNYGYVLRIGFNPSASDYLEIDDAYNMIIPANAYKMVKFVPDVTGYYDFFTDQTSGDALIHLFNETGGLIASDDNDLYGTYDALISAYLTAGTTYYLAGQGYNGLASTFDVYVIPSINNRARLTLNSYLQLTVSNTLNVYEFVAPYSGTYDFYTCDRVSGDPYLELYDSYRQKIAYNDDGNGDLNSLITVYLTAGEEYYIHLTSFNNKASTYVFSIRLSIKNRTVINTSQDSSASVSLNVNEVNVFKFVAQENRNYTIQTNNIISGDPYLQLMDSRGVIMYEDDDSAGERNSQINFLATAGEEYYIVCMGYKKDIRNQYNLIIK